LFLVQKPVREAASLRKGAICENNISTDSSYKLDSSVKAVEIVAEFKYDRHADFNIEISFGNDENLVVSVNGENEKIILDRSLSGNTGFCDNFKGNFQADLVQIKEYLKLDIFVDINTIEVFVNEGFISLSSLIFPREHIKSIKISLISSCTMLKNIEIYKLS